VKLQHKVELKEIGLDIGLAFARHVYRTDYLHYGYWPEGLEVLPANVRQAQENYANLLLQHIPEGVQSILDVGCGSGKFAEVLVERGYTVDCVSPSPKLTEHARKRLGDRAHVFECRFEDLETHKRYDLLLFSESFQYLLLERAFEVARTLLNPNGALLICDFFKRDEAPDGQPFAPGEKSPISGGHGWQRFQTFINSQPFVQVHEMEITRETAPSLDIMRDLIQELIAPTWHAFSYYFRSNYPRFSAKFSKVFERKISQTHRKYLSGNTNGAQFFRFKTYRLLVYRHQESA
jgi:SAM-dependent methyltransferase